MPADTPADTADADQTAQTRDMAQNIARNAAIDNAPSIFDRILGVLSNICLLVSGIALVVLTTIFGWLVYGRYVLNATPTWVEQMSLLLVMVITFIGASAGIYERTHLSVRMFRANLPRLLRRAGQCLCHIVLLGFGALMAVYSYELVVFKWGSLIPLLGVPEGLRAIPIMVAGGLIALFSLGHIIRLVRGFDEDLEDEANFIDDVSL